MNIKLTIYSNSLLFLTNLIAFALFLSNTNGSVLANGKVQPKTSKSGLLKETRIPAALDAFPSSSHVPSPKEIRLCVIATGTLCSELRTYVTASKTIDDLKLQNFRRRKSRLIVITRSMRGACNGYINAHGEFVYPERAMALENLLIAHTQMDHAIQALHAKKHRDAITHCKHSLKSIDTAFGLIEKRIKPDSKLRIPFNTACGKRPHQAEFCQQQDLNRIHCRRGSGERKEVPIKTYNLTLRTSTDNQECQT